MHMKLHIEADLFFIKYCLFQKKLNISYDTVALKTLEMLKNPTQVSARVTKMMVLKNSWKLQLHQVHFLFTYTNIACSEPSPFRKENLKNRIHKQTE